MLRDDGPPVSPETLADARANLPLEYGYRIVTERGRKVLLVRSPRAKPDYLHELAEVALYVSLDEVREVRDVVLVGHEKSTRLEPIALRDRIKEQLAEDATTADDLRKRLRREYGHLVVQSPRHKDHKALAVRVPRRSVTEFSPEDVHHLRDALRMVLERGIKDCQMAYLVADVDFERLGRRVFLELVGVDAAPASGAAPSAPAVSPMDATNALKAAAMASAGLAPVARAAAPAPAPVPVRVTAPAPAPRAPEPEPQPDPQPVHAQMESISADDNTEVYVRKPKTGAPPPTPVRVTNPPPPPPPASARAVPGIVAREPADSSPAGYLDGPTPSRVSERVEETEEYEVFVSKPKVASPPPPPISLPRRGGGDEPAGAPPSIVSPHGPSQDNGLPMEPSVVARVDHVQSLRARFQAAGYEIMAPVEVMGHTFDLAAHRVGGKRVLVKRVPTLDAETPTALSRVTDDLGADVCIIVAESVSPGARLAAWGTKVVLMSPEEASRAAL